MAMAARLMGRDHAVLGRNLQDHAVATSAVDHAVAAVSDGCGEGEGSEVGARIASLVGCRAAEAALGAGASMDALVHAVGQAVLAALEAVVDVVAGDDPAARARFADEHLAVTLWIAATRGPEGIVFGWGDGVLRVDDRVVVVDQGGRPAYLLGAVGTGTVPEPSRIVMAPDAAVVAVATDGWREDDLREVPLGAPSSGLLRWMRLRQRNGAFRDDGAVAALVATPSVAP